jgi:hypothetical protein
MDQKVYVREDRLMDWACCRNINSKHDEALVACDEPAKHFYLHNGGVCSYCDEHNYACGEPIGEQDAICKCGGEHFGLIEDGFMRCRDCKRIWMPIP